jgi:hypothetical protein
MSGMIVSDFNDLLKAFDPLIMGERRYMSNLYDIWVMGAPSLDSIILDPKHYNPEINKTVKRIIPTSWLKPYLRELASSRGIPLGEHEISSILGETYA